MNLKNETLRILEENDKDFTYIKWAVLFIDFGDSYKDIILPPNYTKEDLDKFINNIDFDYDDGFGGQEVFGKIMLVTDSWLERNEYDGSEWWEYKRVTNFETALYELREETKWNRSLKEDLE